MLRRRAEVCEGMSSHCQRDRGNVPGDGLTLKKGLEEFWENAGRSIKPVILLKYSAFIIFMLSEPGFKEILIPSENIDYSIP